ncbi:hypothetical protein Patl1_37261 [Pistacia atlantica]|nr:hypothetical protein Patl1_37261 [Pistacia atlantica]
MKYERAYPDQNGTIQLVSRTDMTGRATYNGLAFFLAPGGSIIPTVKGGGSFGHTKDDEPLNSTSNPFVAVEFDIFYNIGWDPIPSSDHVGIDISSMRSSTNVSWWSSVEGGQRNEAWISYNSSTQNLSVAFTGFRNNVTVMQYLDYEIDLRLYLPELVTFGFSAATGSRYAIFSVYSWEFNSSLEAANRPPPSDNSTPIVERESRRRISRAGLAVGLSISGAFLVGGLLLVWLAVIRRKRHGDADVDRHGFSKYMDDEIEKGTGPKRFSFKELAGASNNFNDEHKLGEGVLM